MASPEASADALVAIALSNDAALLDAYLQRFCTESNDAINDRGQHDRTALMLACAWHAHHTVHLLLRRGANCNLKDPDGNTALHLAAENNAKRCLHHLLQTNVLLDEQNAWGWTALHLSAAEGALECTKALLIAGARPDIVSHVDRETPLDAALKEGHADVVALLRTWDPAWSKRRAATPGIATWTAADVAKFLRKLSLPQYEDAFHAVDGLGLMQLTDDALETAFGMVRPAHRLRLLEAIALERLNATRFPSPPSEAQVAPAPSAVLPHKLPPLTSALQPDWTAH
ncbi:hypothetical protein ACHHYP_03431 [Achlya hypogyna]|uniref:SAM domain-containing protein n=1 Tax=Achlya hypogyna TaxID=1202772 RepID=A0A1V9ZR91_ACHHY|nr:hypothetical protein ACHHYP_03431 [Achlya hypogyna]